MSLGKYLISKVFWKNIGFAALATFIIYFLVVFGLRISTLHGKSFPVPDFRGMTLEEVNKTVAKKNLRFQLIDSVYNNNYKRGSIVEQNPEPGFHVKKNRNIFLTINAFNPEMVKVPNVSGLSLRQAKATLERSGLYVGKLTYEPDIATNNVLQQKYNNLLIETEQELIKGSKIELVLGKFSENEKTNVPDLRGVALLQAIDQITLASLNLGVVHFDESFVTKIDSAKAKVYDQYPGFEADKKLKLGGKINLWVTINPDKLVFEKDKLNDF